MVIETTTYETSGGLKYLNTLTTQLARPIRHVSAHQMMGWPGYARPAPIFPQVVQRRLGPKRIEFAKSLTGGHVGEVQVITL